MLRGIALGVVSGIGVIIALSLPSCQSPPASTAVDVAGLIRCVAADTEKGVTQPAIIAHDCGDVAVSVVIDVISTLDRHVAATCQPPMSVKDGGR